MPAVRAGCRYTRYTSQRYKGHVLNRGSHGPDGHTAQAIHKAVRRTPRHVGLTCVNATEDGAIILSEVNTRLSSKRCSALVFKGVEPSEASGPSRLRIPRTSSSGWNLAASRSSAAAPCRYRTRLRRQWAPKSKRMVRGAIEGLRAADHRGVAPTAPRPRALWPQQVQRRGSSRRARRRACRGAPRSAPRQEHARASSFRPTTLKPRCSSAQAASISPGWMGQA